MIEQLFPEQFDNSYRGHNVALWLFGFLLLLKITMSLNSIFNGASVAGGADGIPLSTYPAAAARTIVAEFSLLGVANLMMCLIGIVALSRYRSMVPMLFSVFLAEFLIRRALLQLIPIARTGTPPGLYVNLFLLLVMCVGLPLSLTPPSSRQVIPSPSR